MMYGAGYVGNNQCIFTNGWYSMIMIGIIILVVIALIYLFRKSKQQTLDNTTFELLKTKYVQGEISEEEYLKRKNVLTRK